MPSKPPHLNSSQPLAVTWSNTQWELGISLSRLNAKSLNRITVKSLSRSPSSAIRVVRASIPRFTIQRSLVFHRHKSVRPQKTPL